MHPTRFLAAALAAAAALLPGTAGADWGDAVAIDPPVEMWQETAAGLAVSGTYTPIVGDFGGVGGLLDDIIWYAPGATTDYLWTSDGDRTFTTQPLPVQVSGSYTPLVGDFAGSGLDDIFWYAPGAAADYLWTSTGDGFTTTPLSVSGSYQPVVADDLGGGKDDIVWAKVGGGPGSIWSFEGGGAYLTHAITSPTGSRPLVGHFNGGVCADVFWYAPGTSPDALWFLDCSGNIGANIPQTVNGTYQPTVNSYSPPPGADELDDILWHRHPGGSSLWQSDGDGTWTSSAHTIPVAGTPLPTAKNWGFAHIWSPTLPDLVFWKTAADDYVAATDNTQLGSGYQPVLGNFVGAGADIFWYAPGNGAERLFSNP